MLLKKGRLKKGRLFRHWSDCCTVELVRVRVVVVVVGGVVMDGLGKEVLVILIIISNTIALRT